MGLAVIKKIDNRKWWRINHYEEREGKHFGTTFVDQKNYREFTDVYKIAGYLFGTFQKQK